MTDYIMLRQRLLHVPDCIWSARLWCVAGVESLILLFDTCGTRMEPSHSTHVCVEIISRLGMLVAMRSSRERRT